MVGKGERCQKKGWRRDVMSAHLRMCRIEERGDFAFFSAGRRDSSRGSRNLLSERRPEGRSRKGGRMQVRMRRSLESQLPGGGGDSEPRFLGRIGGVQGGVFGLGEN